MGCSSGTSKETIKAAVKEFAQQMTEDFEQVPKQEIIIGDGIAIETKEIPKPSEFLTYYSSEQDDLFRDVAITLLEEGENGQEISEDNILNTTNNIFNFAGDVLDYSGGYCVNEEAFNAAYQDTFKSESPQGLREFELIIPFENLNLADEPIQLSTDFQIWNDSSSHHRILELELAKLTEPEISGIMTYEAEHGYPRRSPQKVTKYGLRGRIQSSIHPNPNDQPGVKVGRRIATALRLFDPSRGSVGSKDAYLAKSGWLDHREGIKTVVKKSESSREPPLSQDLYELFVGEDEGFQEFWSEYASEIRIDHNYDLATSIRRYNETYVKHYYEDQLIDCAVALESMLLFGDSNPGTRSSRMKLRGSILLDTVFNEDRDRTRTLIDDVYEFRGEIVHQNEYLANVLKNNDRIDLLDGCDHPQEVISEARTLLGKVLRAYLKLRSDGYSISKVNEMIDESIEDASFSILE